MHAFVSHSAPEWLPAGHRLETSSAVPQSLQEYDNECIATTFGNSGSITSESTSAALGYTRACSHTLLVYIRQDVGHLPL